MSALPDIHPPPNQIAETLMTCTEVLALLRISRSALHYWRERGWFPRPIEINRRCIRWRRSDVLAWLEKSGPVLSPSP